MMILSVAGQWTKSGQVGFFDELTGHFGGEQRICCFC